MGTPLASGERQAVSEVGLRLQRLRRKAGLSQAAVAERLNRDFNAHVNKGMISKYENGIHEPSAGTVFCLAKVLGVSTEYLMGKTDALQTFAAQQGADLPGRVIKVYSRYNSIDGGECEPDTVELVPPGWLVGGREYIGVRVRGGALAPRYYDGDLVIFERCFKMDRDRVALVSFGGDDAIFCFIQRKRGGKWFSPLELDKPEAYYTTRQMEEMPVRIIGAAVQVRRMEPLSR